MKQRPRKRWTVEEDNQLIESLNSGTSIEDIAKQHNRTIGSIKSRMKNEKIIRLRVAEIEETQSIMVELISSLDSKSEDIDEMMSKLDPEELKVFLLQKKQMMPHETYLTLINDLRKIFDYMHEK